MSKTKISPNRNRDREMMRIKGMMKEKHKCGLDLNRDSVYCFEGQRMCGREFESIINILLGVGTVTYYKSHARYKHRSGEGVEI